MEFSIKGPDPASLMENSINFFFFFFLNRPLVWGGGGILQN